MALFKRVLIANRAEIAIRIAKAASILGIESVGVHAAIDSLSLHTRFTTQSRLIGAQTDTVSAYLDVDAMVAVAQETGCDCVHPGYGFLSENAAFAQACERAGLVFVGPRASELFLFGDKTKARKLAQSLNIPVVPGSEPVATPAEAHRVGEQLGYPLFLKAAAGGGGRGLRVVNTAAELSAAFERCRSEAQTAFGDGTLFIEKRIDRPRHIEVQVLADSTGRAVHLYERDCSIQQRNQKVVEIAPAPGLSPSLRESLLADAIRLVSAVKYVNAGTVEFLVSPETGEYFFIECNPRVQVEHTITEQITGVDLVESQFQIAAGETLASIGILSQADITAPRCFSIQSRVVARGAGTLLGYKEPSGPGVRVDAHGYAGYTPPPQFDPLLAKVIVTSRSFESAVQRSLRALEEFHVSGLPTNIAQLRAILRHRDVRDGNARTPLVDATPSLSQTQEPTTGGAVLDFLNLRQAEMSNVRSDTLMSVAAASAPMPALPVGEDQRGVEAATDGTVVEVCKQAGDSVALGDTLVVVSAMKMESMVSAPCAGVIVAMQPLAQGDRVISGQILAVLNPAPSGQETPIQSENTWHAVLDDVATLHKLALERLSPASRERGVVRQRDRGKLTCRERIDLLLDEGSFREVGSIAGFASYNELGEIDAFTPANHVGGWGKIDGRTAVVCADDFSSRGGHADGAIGQKSRYLDKLSMELRSPSIRLLDGSSGGGSVATMVPRQSQPGESNAEESSGAIEAGRPRVTGTGGSFLPGHLGSEMYAEQLAMVPVVNLLLGSVVGIGAAKAVLGHFSVMVRNISQLFVAGPPVVSHAVGYDISKEDLGGWHIHCRNGSVDNLAETEHEAMQLTKRFLSYLPSNVCEAPPKQFSSDPPDRRDDELLAIIPRKRTTTFDIRKVIRLLADRESFFEIGPHWGTDQVTGLVRFNGYPMGVIASDSQHKNGGALTADGCRKLIRHQDLCDLFHLPILNLVDNPGFAVGLEHELAGTIRKGGEWMIAFSQVKVPLFTVLLRRSFGVAGNNYATPLGRTSVRVTWPAADTGGIPPEGGIEAAYKRQLAEAEDPVALRAELEARIESARGPLGPLSRFEIEEMIDPRDTRRYICEWIDNAHTIATQSHRLAPRQLRFRP